MDKDKINRLREIRIEKLLGIEETGRKIFVRCPVHRERSASLVIYPDGSYHCFGCSLHGRNAIDFIISLGGTFIEALEELDKIK